MKAYFPFKKENCTRSITQHERDDWFFSWPSYYSRSWDCDLAWICHQRFVFSQGIGWLLYRRAWRTLFRLHRKWDPRSYTQVRLDFRTHCCWTPRCTCHCPWLHRIGGLDLDPQSYSFGVVLPPHSLRLLSFRLH